jgi:hypothetical protein
MWRGCLPGRARAVRSSDIAAAPRGSARLRGPRKRRGETFGRLAPAALSHGVRRRGGTVRGGEVAQCAAPAC